MGSESAATLLQQIKAGDGLFTLREILLKFAASGGTQAEAVNALTEMLEDATDKPQEDAIRDALDLATGWCSEHLRVWPDEA